MSLLGFRLLPEQASTIAGQVDALLLFLTAVSAFFAGLIFLAVIVFAIKYRRRSEKEQPRPIHGSLALEIFWTVIPLGLTMIMFGWGAWLYFSMSRPPADSMEIFVVGKQWMWKLQHPGGQREINELHVPVGKPVKLMITSEDVIHSFFIPAFRMKKDAIPGRYNVAWFEPTKPGTYHLFCAEYCGTEHARMVGRVVVMEPDAYQTWLAGGPVPVSPAAAGEKLFTERNCVTCHRGDTAARGPRLAGIFGKRIELHNGETVVADESYIRESILSPAAKVVAGYQPIMPTYQGQVTEEQLLQLIAYIQSLPPPSGEPAPASPATAPGGAQ